MEEKKKPEIASRMKNWWASLTPEQRAVLKQKQRKGMKSYWERLSQEERAEIAKNVSAAKKAAASVRKERE